MITGLTSPSGGDLKQLRQHYDRLCDVMTRTAESDPEAAERVLGELQILSERIQTLESAGPAAADAAAEDGVPVATDAAPAPARSSHIVSFPTAPTIGRREPAAAAAPAPPPASAPPAMPAAPLPSWRIDEPPAELSPRSPAAPHEPVTGEPGRAPLAGSPDIPAAAPRPGNATVFSTAIRQWLERHRGTPPADQASSAERPRASLPSPPATAPAAGPPVEPSSEFAHITAAIEQQAIQIERIMRLCEAHQAALERLETRIEKRLLVPEPAADAAEPGIGELRRAVEEQRRRITALAKTIHNLAQWLAAHRAAPDR